MSAFDPYEEVLSALLEALFPVITLDADDRNGLELSDDVASFAKLPGNHSPQVAAEVLRTMRVLPPESQRELFLLLELLRWRAGTLLLGGLAAVTAAPPFCRPFAQLSVPARERVLQGWAESYVPQFVKAFKALKSISMSTLFSFVDAKGRNPLWPGIQYKGPDPLRPAQPLSAKAASERALMAATLDLAAGWGDAVALPAALQDLGLSCQRAQEEDGSQYDGVVTCDAVVVGSGAGGGVAAALLAQAGMQVVVLEKGRYQPAAQLSLLEADAFGGMYEGCGLAASDDAGINILAGATLGGGTRINWSASFETPAHVRREWAEEYGLTAFESPAYAEALTAVTSRLGVTTGIREHSRGNARLAAGLQRLGVHCGEIPRNSDTGHACGSCGFGCASGAKQDGTATFLADAVQAGAKILTGAFAERILMSDSASTSGRTQQVSSVLVSACPDARQARQEQREPLRLLLRCKYAVSAAGALHTPALLLRSGVAVGGNVGANLRLHPATVVTAVFPQGEGPVLGWEGAIMSVFSREAADWEGSGYGPLLATPSAHPGLTAASFPWPSGAVYKRKTLTFPQTAGALVYVRDRGSGRVYLGPDGLPRVRYWPSDFDRTSMLKGMELGLRAMVAAGAESVMTLHSCRQMEFVPQRDARGELANVKEFEQYIDSVHAEGVRLNRMAVLTAHQMGSARIGVSRDSSVADPAGECWDVHNLYIADASALPTSTGVNPMVTVESVAYMIAQGLARRHQKAQAANGPIPNGASAH